MEKFIKKVLSEEKLSLALFDFVEFFEVSTYEKEMFLLYEYDKNSPEETPYIQHYKRVEYLVKNTKWHYIDDEQNIVGTIEDNVITCDSEGTINYFCKGFQNIPLMRQKDFNTSLDIYKEKLKNYCQLDYDAVLKQYKEICKEFELPLFLEENIDTQIEEFEKNIERKIE